jgi:hypothetical protein
VLLRLRAVQFTRHWPLARLDRWTHRCGPFVRFLANAHAFWWCPFWWNPGGKVFQNFGRFDGVHSMSIWRILG